VDSSSAVLRQANSAWGRSPATGRALPATAWGVRPSTLEERGRSTSRRGDTEVRAKTVQFQGCVWCQSDESRFWHGAIGERPLNEAHNAHPRYGLQSCEGDCAGVVKRRRHFLSPTRSVRFAPKAKPLF
jgi:hypothetical protein